MSVKLPYKDSNLLTRSFRLMSDGIADIEDLMKKSDYDLYVSFFSTAIGDNRYINPLPGYGFNTDPYPEPLMKNTMGNMGRYYKRIHHDTAQTVTLSAGVPEFTGILDFLINMFDYSASTMVNKGRAPTWSFYIGQAAGAIAFWPAQIFATSMNFFQFLTTTPKNKWFYHKASPGAYFTAAQGIFNDLMVAAGYTLTVLPKQGNVVDLKAGEPAGNGDKGYKTRSAAAQAQYSYMSSLFPGAINEDGTIDIMKVSLRGVRKYRYMMKKVKDLDKSAGIRNVEEKDSAIATIIENLMKDGNFVNGNIGPAANKGVQSFLMDELQSVGKYRSQEEGSYPEMASAYTDPAVYTTIDAEGRSQGMKNEEGGAYGITDIQKKMGAYDQESGFESVGVSDNGQPAPITLEGTVPTSFDDGTELSKNGFVTEVGALLMDQFYGGMDGVTFRVEGTGSVSDSFSNQTEQSALASSFNGTVKAVSDFKFNMGGGVTGIGIIDSFMEQVTGMAAGIASGSVIGNVPLALLGNSRVEIPEHWSDSSTNLHTETFEFYFEAPYAHPYSIATNIFLPASLILPFVVPFSTGGSTYGSPFLVKAFQQGKSVIRNGIVKNATMEWGTGPLGWTLDMKPRNLRITLEVADLDQIMSAPISRVSNPLDILNIAAQSSRYLGDVGKYNDWVNRVAGVDYLDTVLRYNDVNRRLTRFTTDVEQMFTPARIASVVSDSIAADIYRALGAGRPLDR